MNICSWTITFAREATDQYDVRIRESYRQAILVSFPTRKAVSCYYQHESAMQQLEIRCDDKLRLSTISELVELPLVKSVLVVASKPVEERLGSHKTPEGVEVRISSTAVIALDNDFDSATITSFDGELNKFFATS